MLKSALQCMDEIKAKAKHPAFFFDYDGTLTPIVAKPELAVLSQPMRDCLCELNKHYNVAIISGRKLSDVKACVGLDGVYYAGNHGLEILIPQHEDVACMMGSEFKATMDSIYQELEAELGAIKGILIEHKIYTLSVHYRLVAPSIYDVIERAVNQCLQAHENIRLHLGKKVFELRPKLAWNKGHAVNYLMQLLQDKGEKPYPIYLGDDVTDEDAFREVQHKGVGVLVSDEARQTAAGFQLASADEVRVFLEKFI